MEIWSSSRGKSIGRTGLMRAMPRPKSACAAGPTQTQDPCRGQWRRLSPLPSSPARSLPPSLKRPRSNSSRRRLRPATRARAAAVPVASRRSCPVTERSALPGGAAHAAEQTRVRRQHRRRCLAGGGGAGHRRQGGVTSLNANALLAHRVPTDGRRLGPHLARHGLMHEYRDLRRGRVEAIDAPHFARTGGHRFSRAVLSSTSPLSHQPPEPPAPGPNPWPQPLTRYPSTSIC